MSTFIIVRSKINSKLTKTMFKSLMGYVVSFTISRYIKCFQKLVDCPKMFIFKVKSKRVRVVRYNHTLILLCLYYTFWNWTGAFQSFPLNASARHPKIKLRAADQKIKYWMDWAVLEMCINSTWSEKKKGSTSHHLILKIIRCIWSGILCRSCKSGPMTGFKGFPYQRCSGLGSIFLSLFRMTALIFKSTATSVGKRLWQLIWWQLYEIDVKRLPATMFKS